MSRLSPRSSDEIAIRKSSSKEGSAFWDADVAILSTKTQFRRAHRTRRSKDQSARCYLQNGRSRSHEMEQVQAQVMDNDCNSIL